MIPALDIKALLFAVSVVAMAGGAAWLYHKGGEGAATKIERQNNDAADQSDVARSDYDRCRDGGRLWDFSAGKCVGASPRRRN